MQARVARMIGRMKRDLLGLAPLRPYYSPIGGGRYGMVAFAAEIYDALDRPGVAPTRKPKNADGGETFHFALTTVSKTSSFTRLLTGEREGSAAAHESYIEREDAPEAFAHAQARFLEQSGPVSSVELADGVKRGIQGHAYIERKHAIEAADRDADTLSMYGNLPDDFAARLGFWEAVEAHEREPRTHFLSIDPSKVPDLWKRIESDPAAPPEVLAAGRLPPRVIQTKKKSDNPRTHELLGQLKLTEDRAPAIQTYLKSIKGWDEFCFWTPGRGGRIQMRLIISLPYELTADERLTLLKKFCDAQFRNLKANDGSYVHVPFWAVVHKPEATSDDRNYHAHIVFSERPARLIEHPQTGEQTWDFACAVSQRDSKRTLRIRRPFEQAKVRSFNDRDWPGRARCAFAELANQLLEARGHAKRLDARSYAAMGIELEPIRRIKPNAFAKEKKGQTTASGNKTIAAQWQRVTDDLDQTFPSKSFFPPAAQQIQFDQEINRRKKSESETPKSLTDTVARLRKAWARTRTLEANVAAGEVAIARIRSKIDAPGKSMLRDNLEMAQVLTALADKYVVKPRLKAANHRAICDQLCKDATALMSERGPGISIGIGEKLTARSSVVDATPAKPDAPVTSGTKKSAKDLAKKSSAKELVAMAKARIERWNEEGRQIQQQWEESQARLARARATRAERNSHTKTLPSIESLLNEMPSPPTPAPKGALADAAAAPSPAKAAPTPIIPAAVQTPKAQPIPKVAAVEAKAVLVGEVSPTKKQAAPAREPSPAPAAVATPADAAPPPASRVEKSTANGPAKSAPVSASVKTGISSTGVAATSKANAPDAEASAPMAGSPEPTSLLQSQPSAPRPTKKVTRAVEVSQEAPPEPPRASQEVLDALERRKKRRYQMFLGPKKERGWTR